MERRPLVLISGKDVLDGIGGHESYVRAHALAAARTGLDPHIFCVSHRSETTTAPFGTVHRVAPPLGLRLPPALHAPLLARAVVRFLSARPGPHVIHGFAIWAAAAAAAARAMARRGVPAVALASAYGTRAFEVGAMQRGLRPHHGLAQRVRYRAWLQWIRLVDDRIERWGYSCSQLVLVNYVSVQRILTSAYGSGLPIRRFPYTSPDAILETDATSDFPVPEPIARLGAAHAPLVLAVSRHDPRKGIDVLLLALAELAASGVEFRACLVGPGRLLDAHRRLAAELGLDEQVVITGRAEDVRPYYDCADIFVLPSVAEASGSVSVLEALRARTAVVASACDGIPEDLTPEYDALLVAPGDVQALSRALTLVLTDPALRAQLAQRGHATYERKFSAAGFEAALGSVYAELTASET
jgi:glycosyltransferase involved in cell wall biosynthesis